MSKKPDSFDPSLSFRSVPLAPWTIHGGWLTPSKVVDEDDGEEQHTGEYSRLLRAREKREERMALPRGVMNVSSSRIERNAIL